MALKVKAKERLLKVGKYANTYRYMMTRRIVFTPSTELKDELKTTNVVITLLRPQRQRGEACDINRPDQTSSATET